MRSRRGVAAGRRRTPPAISLVGANTTVETAFSGDYPVNMPAGAAGGDLLVVSWIAWSSGPNYGGPPSGWTDIGSRDIGDYTYGGLYRRFAAGVTPSLVLHLTSPASNFRACAVAFRNAEVVVDSNDVAEQIGGNNWQRSWGTSESISTPWQAGDWVAGLFASQDDNGNVATIVPPTGWTKDAELNPVHGGTGKNCSICHAAPANNAFARAFTYSKTGGTATCYAWAGSLLMRPAA